MKKILFYAGGQPFKSSDFKIIQDSHYEAFIAMIKGLMGGPCIISGLQPALSGPPYPDEGYIYDGTDICYVTKTIVPILNQDNFYILRPITETDTPRTFYSGETRNIVENKYYEVYSGTVALEGEFVLNDLSRMGFILPDTFKLLNQYEASILTGFIGLNGYSAIVILYNAVTKNVMLSASFGPYLNAGSDLLATLPEQVRPEKDIAAFYYDGTVNQAMIIKANGEIRVRNCSGVNPNYISFQYCINWDDFTP